MMWRLPEAKHNPDVAQLIDFETEVSFKLNGTKLTGLAGDTVFSAAISCGFCSSGFFNDHPLGIDVELAPLIWVRHNSEYILANSAVFRIVQNCEYFIFDAANPEGPKNSIVDRLLRMFSFSKKANTFGTDLSEGSNAWSAPIGSYRMSDDVADVTVVGGGVAGLKAAIAAAKNGNSVLLCERSGSLGGLAHLFGSQVDGMRASVRIPMLIEQLKAFPKVTIWLNCHVTQANVGSLEALRSGPDADKPLIRAKISAGKIILATGQKNIPPPFQGNRSARTISVTSAYVLARDFGVFPGKTFASFSAENVAYNLLLILAKAGAVARMAIDYRLSVSSRFVEFLKAYGVTSLSAVSPSRSRLDSSSLSIEFRSNQSVEVEPRQLELECLIVSNDWQPELDLWIDLGGGVSWDSSLKKLVARDTIAGVELTGAVCNEWLETDTESDQFESPREQVALTEENSSDFPVFLNSGRNFSTIEPQVAKRAGTFFSSLIGSRGSKADVGVHSNALDFAVLVNLDRLPAEAVSELVEEKCFSIQKSGREFANFVEPESVIHLGGLIEQKFGPSPISRSVTSTEGGLVRGALLFETGAPPDARYAIGSIVAKNEDGWTAILNEKSKNFKNCAAMVSGRRITCVLDDVAKTQAPDANTTKPTTSKTD